MGKYLFIGGSTGIGEATARILLSGGHEVIMVTRKTEDDVKIPGASIFQGDIIDAAAQLPIIEGHIDGLAYFPGSINLKPFRSLNRKDFENDMEVNFYGALRAIQFYLENLKQSQSPSIVLFSTVAAKVGMPFHASVAASKSAIEGLTISLAAEFAPKIRVNAIAPSLTNTPLATRLLNTEEKQKMAAERHPLKKVGEASDLGEMTAFLLTEKSKWMTGQILHVDGGMSSLKV